MLSRLLRAAVPLVIALSASSPELPRKDAHDEEEDELAEIEVIGSLSSVPSASKYVIYAQTRPCALDGIEDTRPVGIDSLLAEDGRVFAFEAAMDEDDDAYVCAIAFDAERRVVGFGGTSDRPVPVARTPGEEYGRAHGVEVPLTPLDPPLAIDNAALLHHAI